jgi:hypothetical protein
VSVESVALVLNHSRATGRDKLVLVGIANHDGDGGAWPSIETLARYANASERSVQRSIANLVELGELEVDRNAGGRATFHGGRRPNLYRILVGRPGDIPANQIQPNVTPVDNPEGGVTRAVTPAESRGDSPGSSGVTPVGVQKVHRTTTPQTPHCDRHVKHRRTCPDCRQLLAEAEAAAEEAARPPAWCGECDPAGEHAPGQRFVDRDVGGRLQLAPCPRCHPSTVRRSA